MFIKWMDVHKMANIAFLASLPDNILGNFQKQQYDVLHVELYDDCMGYLMGYHPLTFITKANAAATHPSMKL